MKKQILKSALFLSVLIIGLSCILGCGNSVTYPNNEMEVIKIQQGSQKGYSVYICGTLGTVNTRWIGIRKFEDKSGAYAVGDTLQIIKVVGDAR